MKYIYVLFMAIFPSYYGWCANTTSIFKGAGDPLKIVRGLDVGTIRKELKVFRKSFMPDNNRDFDEFLNKKILNGLGKSGDDRITRWEVERFLSSEIVGTKERIQKWVRSKKGKKGVDEYLCNSAKEDATEEREDSGFFEDAVWMIEVFGEIELAKVMSSAIKGEVEADYKGLIRAYL